MLTREIVNTIVLTKNPVQGGLMFLALGYKNIKMPVSWKGDSIGSRITYFKR